MKNYKLTKKTSSSKNIAEFITFPLVDENSIIYRRPIGDQHA